MTGRPPTSQEIAIAESRVMRKGTLFELGEEIIDGRRYRICCNGPQTLTDVYASARRNRQSVLLVRAGERYSYRDVFDRARALSAQLAARIRGEPGARIALAIRDEYLWIAAFIAATSIGASAVLVPEFDWPAIRSYCEIADARFVVTDTPVDANRAGHAVLAACENGSFRSWSALEQADGGADDTNVPAISPESEAIVAFTSGATGVPKGAILSHRGVTAGLINMMLASALSQARNALYASGPRRRPSLPSIVLFAPLSHISGYGQLLLTMMLSGKIILARGDTRNLIEREKATSLAGIAPNTLREFIRHAPPKESVATLASLSMSGTASDPKLVSEVRESLPDVVIGASYGMTETNGSICAIVGAEMRRHSRAAGKILPTVECRIARPDGSNVSEGERGQVFVRGAMTFKGYCGQRAGLDADGWFATGDVGCVSRDGYLHIVAREQTAAVHGLEEIVSSWPDLDEGVVLFENYAGHPTSIRVVFTSREHTAIDLAGLRQALAAALQGGGPAMRFTQIESFPRTRSGKIDRKRLLQETGG